MILRKYAQNIMVLFIQSISILKESKTNLQKTLFFTQRRTAKYVGNALRLIREIWLRVLNLIVVCIQLDGICVLMKLQLSNKESVLWWFWNA